MSEFVGPALPPHLGKSTADDASSDEDICNEETESIIGPVVPPSHNTVEKDDDALFGPALPPNLLKPAVEKVIGPTLPPGFDRSDLNQSDSDEEIIGPLPLPQGVTLDEKKLIAIDFEDRSKKMKDKLTGNNKTEKLEREEWMTELPPVLQGFGMGPRSFKMNPTKIGDRSVWTDTPQEKAKKAQKQQVTSKLKPDPISKYVRERDNEIAKQISSLQPEDEQESLMSMHEKTRKRKLKEEEKTSGNVRRPFDRETDLQANRFDEAAKKRMMKQSQGLASRFSHGETSATFL
uniref:GPALPP motifs-containing protein 1 n=1 Tax=Phallusia mammillata TaxID=59560 RepID=A0A6F9DEM8_9ASCI|nr:GPALPP motifs-containing protein 1-like [Phallusia mammillata]